ncbi:nuclease-related domain-containing protein [Rhodococcus sp. OK302]|uniref:nuclease-related domain-containing protein n=1 Tax=Rhodococcus sp. OK302 TaxID=1882769 RepID=UPI000B9F4DE8|nr:nuclease-related domain-containing protein [Rhodococcus sp. OK302]OYD61360.1 nuclease-like protein [Rhodococcus sp. OK302]
MTVVNALLVGLAVVLVGALAAAIWWHQRSRKAWNANSAHTAQAFGLNEAAAASRYQNAVSTMQAQQSADVSRLRGEHQRKIDELSAERDNHLARYSTIKDSYVLAIGQGELTSRDRLLYVCNRIGLDAIVVTNLVFRPVEAQDTDPFHAQIDHLLITRTGMLIVESKYWKGVIFDGVDIRTHHSALASLLATESIERVSTGKRAMRIRSSDVDRTEMRVMLHPSPAEQVRRQAVRLSELLKSRQVQPPWISTCVFYSHTDAVVQHARSNGATALVSDPAGLEQTVRALGKRANGAVLDVDALARVLAPLGPDICGVGAHAEQWGSPLDM